MIKKILSLLILFSAMTSYSQKQTLIKNYNPKAEKFNHSLNLIKDSLLLNSKTTIIKVEIFNKGYNKTILVENLETKIPVDTFVDDTELRDKTIHMDAVKNTDSNGPSDFSFSTENMEAVGGRGMMLDEDLNVINSSLNQSIESILTGEKKKKVITEKQKFYWTLNQINNKLGSTKTMKLVNQESVNKMIEKNKLEQNSVSGKLNTLTVWEVYDTTKFIEKQSSNPDFIYSLTSDSFNVKPYYF